MGRHGKRFVQQAGGGNPGGPQADQTLQNERQGQHGADQQRPDGPASGLNDRKQRVSPRGCGSAPDYGGALGRRSDERRGPCLRGRSLTKSVDNFVGNSGGKHAQTAPNGRLHTLIKKRALKNSIKSMGYHVLAGFLDDGKGWVAAIDGCCGLWSTFAGGAPCQASQHRDF